MLLKVNALYAFLQNKVHKVCTDIIETRNAKQKKGTAIGAPSVRKVPQAMAFKRKLNN